MYKLNKEPEEVDNDTCHDAKWHLEQAMLPRDSRGNVIPIIPTGPGPLADSIGEVFYPHFKPNEEGLVRSIIFDSEFEGGKVPADLEYLPGHERVDKPYDGTNLSDIIYDDPILNLSYRDQLLLKQAQDTSFPPTPPALSHDVAAYLGTPPNFVYPVCVQPHDMGMIAFYEEKSELLSNFRVVAREWRIIKRDGEPDQEEFVLEVLCRDASYPLTVSAADLGKLAPIITRRFPVCHTNESSTKASTRIENYIRDQLHTVPKFVFFCSPGFFRVGDTWVYVHDAAVSPDPQVLFKTGCTIPCECAIAPRQALDCALGLLKLSDNIPVSLTLLLTAHLGPLYNLFQEAGHPPRFILFINGPTGSLKTATASCIFRLFQEMPQTPEATFLDTVAALGLKVGDARGRILVVDDFQPSVTASAGKAKLEKLEFIIRTYGDGSAKARSNSKLGRAKEYKPAGCCVVTGEDTGGSQSSLLRCLILTIAKGEINGQHLKHYQDHPEYLFTHFWHFLDWCGNNGNQIIELIKEEFHLERDFFSANIKEFRQVDAGVELMLTAKILFWYAQTIVGFDDDKYSNICQFCREAIISIVQNSEVQMQERNPIDMYLEALFNMEAAGKFKIAPDQASYISGHHIGFIKDDCWWLLPAEISSLVLHYWKKQGTIFPLDPGKVHALLAEKGLIQTCQESRNGKLKQLYLKKSTLTGRPRMLVLNTDRARDYLECNIC